MASVMFDKLWDEAFHREGELVNDAAALADLYKIASAVEAIRLARFLDAAGQSFFECCDTIDKVQQDRAMYRMKQKLHLSERDMKFIKALLEQKAKKGW